MILPWSLSFGGDLPHAFQAANHQGRPSGLMLGTQTFPGVPVKIFVKQNQVPARRVVAEVRRVAVTGPSPLRIRQKKASQAQGDLIGDLLQVAAVAGTGGTLDLQLVPVMVMVALQGFDNEIIDRKPDGTAPVGVAANIPVSLSAGA